MTVDELLDGLSELSIIEALELVKKLEKRWGVSSIRRVAKLFDAPVEKEVSQQTEFDVILAYCGPRKIEVIKVIRVLTDLGLKEAKDLAEGYAGGVVLRGTDLISAQHAKFELEKAGATVILR
jgi:large subunit ribosomal protein L7/L12